MKKVLFALIATSLLISCNKDDGNNNNGTPSITVKVDGSSRSYDAPAATRQSSGGTEIVTISSPTSAGQGITVEVQRVGAITKGNYTGSAGATIGMADGAEYFVSRNDLINISISDINASHVEGTFSATLQSINSSAVRVLSEGKFYAKF